ncbi:zinc finger, CCHC-type containing protein [Tanacetum coccineum]
MEGQDEEKKDREEVLIPTWNWMAAMVSRGCFRAEGQLIVDSSDWGRILLGVSGPSSQLKFYGSFGLQVHLGFHLLMMVLGASRSPPCGCVVNPLVDFLALVMAHETKHRSGYILACFAIGERHLPIESIIANLNEDLSLFMAANQTTNNNSIKSILDKDKLNGSNFLDWYHNLRIVLGNEKKLHHLEEASPEAPPATATAAVRNAYTRRVVEQQKVACLMLVGMTLEIQKNLEDRPAFEILQELKTMFQQQAEQELFETVKAFHACKQEEGQSVSTYVPKMKTYLDQMERLGFSMPLTIHELHAMLKLAEKGIPKKTHAVLAIRQGQIQKPKSQARGKGKQRGKGKSKLAYDPKLDTRRRAKPVHLAYKGLRGYQKLNREALDLYVGNDNTAAVEAIWSFDLTLLSGMILVLENFYRDNICYFNAFPRDGIFEIDMHNHISTENSIYTCSNKKTKHNLDSTFLWHCRLGHINKKCIEKLQHGGLLK